MTDSSGRYTIVYNGEIYNSDELKREIDSRYNVMWRSKSDTEVIIEGFARFGPNFLERINGIFSLAIYDSIEENLYVLRDPIGVKPLFLYSSASTIIFSSEIKGIIATIGGSLPLRTQSFADQLLYMYIPEPYTIYQGVLSVVPGVLYVCKSGRVISESVLYKERFSGALFKDENEAIEAVRLEFSAAVKRQLVSDVSVSISLSGGLDSSAVAFEAVRQGAIVKDAYSLSLSDFDLDHDRQGDDFHYATIVADKIGVKLNKIVAEKNHLKLLPDLAKFMEDGFCDPAAINMYLICRAARQSGVKVILTGQGADEFMGGYRRYAAERMMRYIPRSLGVCLAFIASCMPARFPGRLNALVRRIKRFCELSGKSQADRILGMFSWTRPEVVRGLLLDSGEIKVGKDLVECFNMHSEMDIVDAMMMVDHRFELRSLNLSYTDRMSMAVGVEARVPFLDFDMIRVMNSIPVHMKIRNGQTKWIFKKAMEGRLPKEVIYREKAGFGLPIRSWLMSESDITKRYLSPEAIMRRGIISARGVEELLREHYSGKNDHSYTIIALLCQQISLERVLP